MDFVEQIKGAVADHADEIKEGVEMLGDFIDEKTDGKFAAQVDQAQEFISDQLGGDK
jgi:TRAP-type mannitol/chloroaromatic compound transport system substrate-binding protein